MHPFFERIEPLAYRAAQLLIILAIGVGGWTVARPYLSTLIGNPLGSTIVVFDVVKLANAQRAVASAFIRPDAAAPDAATSLMAMQKRTRTVIDRVAGAGTLVLVKQAVVSEGLPDITDAVLRELGLPTNVPTQNATSYTLDEAPTNLNLYPSRSKPSSGSGALGSAGKLLP